MPMYTFFLRNLTLQTRLFQTMAWLLCCLSLSACLGNRTPVNTQRYSLPEVSLPTATTPPTRTLILGNLTLADALDSDRILIQLDDITIQATRDHLWSASLSEELRQGLRSRLAQRLPDTLVTDALPGAKLSASRLQLRIDQFQGHLRGEAIMSGQWQWLSADNQLLKIQPFQFSTPLAENGYPALVRALGQDLDKLSDQIASQLKAAPSQP